MQRVSVQQKNMFHNEYIHPIQTTALYHITLIVHSTITSQLTTRQTQAHKKKSVWCSEIATAFRCNTNVQRHRSQPETILFLVLHAADATLYICIGSEWYEEYEGRTVRNECNCAETDAGDGDAIRELIFKKRGNITKYVNVFINTTCSWHSLRKRINTFSQFIMKTKKKFKFK